MLTEFNISALLVDEELAVYVTRIFNWIEDTFSKRSEIPDRAENEEPEKIVSIPGKCAGDPTPTLPVLTSLDASFFMVTDGV